MATATNRTKFEPRYQVRFLRSLTPYIGGDLAVFPEGKALRLVEYIPEEDGGPFAEMTDPQPASLDAENKKSLAEFKQAQKSHKTPRPNPLRDTRDEEVTT